MFLYSKNKRLFTFLPLFILFLLPGCQSNSPAEADKASLLSNVLRLPVPPECDLASRIFTWHDNFFYLYSKYNNAIYVFNTTQEAEPQIIRLVKEGAKRVPAPIALNVLSKDSIVISSAASYELYLLNAQGDLMDKINYNRDNDITFQHISAGSAPNTILYKDNHWIISQTIYRYGAGREYSAEMMVNIPLFLQVNKDSITSLPLFLPKDYFEKGMFESQLSSCFDGQRIVFSLPIRHEIYYTSNNFREVNNKLIPSKYVNLNELRGMDQYPADDPMLFYENAQYRSILYDPYRKKYIRFVKHAIPKEEQTDMQVLTNYPPKFSIQVLSSEFSFEKEIEINGKEAFMHRFFINENGLYLSLDNPSRADYSESYLSFAKIIY